MKYIYIYFSLVFFLFNFFFFKFWSELNNLRLINFSNSLGVFSDKVRVYTFLTCSYKNKSICNLKNSFDRILEISIVNK